ncbi:MAG: uL15 family ribosomal protein [Candidatus Blackburnbacteria bacterium]|nr:uL15 family ribosomal protein [Candidatus Blackburnbacteria bacterium]
MQTEREIEVLTLNSLPKIKSGTKKRLGRGYGSGKGGHTSSRGQKGQKARGKIHPLFEGQKNKKSLIQRLPLLRGKGKLKNNGVVTVQLGRLNVFDNGTTVTGNMMVEKGIITRVQMRKGVKVVLGGTISKKIKLDSSIAASNSVANIIELSGERK